MNRSLSELYLRRGRLLERIATQRADLDRAARPVRAALYSTDRVLSRVRSIPDYIRRHPGIAALAVAALFTLKTARIWRWAKRGFFAWQTWQALRARLSILGARVRS